MDLDDKYRCSRRRLRRQRYVLPSALASLLARLTTKQIALRIEWCRSRARAMRYAEEVEVLLEEMHRVLAFLKWDGNWWRERAQHVFQRLSAPNILQPPWKTKGRWRRASGPMRYARRLSGSACLRGRYRSIGLIRSKHSRVSGFLSTRD
jgi:hypothetical protein